MYEFSKLREDDFEGLDEEIINKEINKKFTKLYEECFFKTLFEKIPDSYKTMLVQQYLCHEQIMNVFNHFYQGELKLGFEGQNNIKNHNIRLISNGRTIIEPSKHIYFVDCKKMKLMNKILHRRRVNIGGTIKRQVRKYIAIKTSKYNALSKRDCN